MSADLRDATERGIELCARTRALSSGIGRRGGRAIVRFLVRTDGGACLPVDDASIVIKQMQFRLLRFAPEASRMAR
jgi:hypothetical protein